MSALESGTAQHAGTAQLAGTAQHPGTAQHEGTAERPAIRRAGAGDYAAIDTLIAEAYAHDYGPQSASGDPMHRAAVRDINYEVWVAEDAAGELLGSVTLRRFGGSALHEDVADHELDLRLLGVSPRARRSGVGAALMGHAAELAAEAGFGAVVLKTAPHMHSAQRLYETLGFARAPERDGLWIGGERILDLLTYVLPVAELPALPVADPDAARSVLGRFPSGVAVVTGGDAPAAALVLQSFVSLSIDPPRVLLSVGKRSTSWPRIAAGGTFAATVLAEPQGDIARDIARPGARDKLVGLPTSGSPRHGHPVLRDGAAWFECAVREEFDGGDHRIIVADVLGFGPLQGAERPLVFAGSRFTGLGTAQRA